MNPVCLGIFVSRDDLATVQRAVRSAIAALPGGSRVDLMVNGNESLALKLKQTGSRPIGGRCEISVWNIACADKGNAWNQHIHTVVPNNWDTFYADSYVRIDGYSIEAMCKTLRSQEAVLGTSAVPSIGRSAIAQRQVMANDGGFHGNLCALSSRAVATLRQRCIKVPLGMYRVDSAMGAFLSYGLANLERKWSPQTYVPVTFEATWACDSKKIYRVDDWVSWWHRRKRQARGDIENAAMKYQLTTCSTPFECLPGDVKLLVEGLASNSPISIQSLLARSQRHRRAYEAILAYVRPSEYDITARRL